MDSSGSAAISASVSTRRGMFGLADVKRDFADTIRWRNALHGFAQAGEWIGMKLVEVAVHGVILVDWAALNGVSGCVKEVAL